MRRGPSYGFGTSPREAFRNFSAPGPGQYTPGDTRAGYPKYGFGTAQRQGAKQAQATSPGPGSYAHRAPMGSEGPKYVLAARRDGLKQTEVPGPGSYDSSGATVNTTQMPKYGFGTSPRGNRQQTLTPGPGSYNSNETMAGPKYTMSTKRDSGASAATPGPGAYCGAHTTFGY